MPRITSRHFYQCPIKSQLNHASPFGGPSFYLLWIYGPAFPICQRWASFFCPSLISSGACTWDISLRGSLCVPSEESQQFLLIVMWFAERCSRRAAFPSLCLFFDASHTRAICFLTCLIFHEWCTTNPDYNIMKCHNLLVFYIYFSAADMLGCMIPCTSFSVLSTAGIFWLLFIQLVGSFLF